MNKSLVITAIAATFALSAPIHADHHEGKMGADKGAEMKPDKGAAYGADAAAFEFGFEEMDRDQDGYISREEAREHERLHDAWDAADTDRDGKVNESEFSAFEDDDANNGAIDR